MLQFDACRPDIYKLSQSTDIHHVLSQRGNQSRGVCIRMNTTATYKKRAWRLLCVLIPTLLSHSLIVCVRVVRFSSNLVEGLPELVDVEVGQIHLGIGL